MKKRTDAEKRDDRPEAAAVVAHEAEAGRDDGAAMPTGAEAAAQAQSPETKAKPDKPQTESVAAKPEKPLKAGTAKKPERTGQAERDRDDQPWIYQTGKEIYQFFSRVKGRLQGIQVFALVGKSGTGKSFRAKLLAEKLELPYIIDDGLLIHDTTILAGKSAKQEKNYISAIRTALFSDEDHREAVIRVIQERKIKKLLILGTSEKMVSRVAEALELPPISQFIHIEEIASREDIENAIKSRFEEGKHVIPVPAIEIKRAFIQNLTDTIRIFFKGVRGGRGSRFFEKSVVQPEFQEHHPGTVTISEAALSQMIIHCVDEYDDDIIVRKIKVKVERGGYGIELAVDVPYGKALSGGEGGLHELRRYIVNNIQKYTGIVIKRLEIAVETVTQRRLDLPRKAG